MNALELEMVDQLKRLKEEYGVVGVKAEYENEGSRMVELMRLKDVIDMAGLPLLIKIGGCEAVSNIYDALSIGAKGIVAPMCETAYAVSKFLNAIETFVAEDNRGDIEWGLTIETETAVRNIKSIMELPNIPTIKRITMGRVDLSGSMGLCRNEIEDGEIFNMCSEVFQWANLYGRRCTLGGAISHKSINNIRVMSESFIDRFETRKLVYDCKSALPKINDGLTEGIRFELAWLKSKRRYYHLITKEDEKRIIMLEERVK